MKLEIEFDHPGELLAKLEMMLVTFGQQTLPAPAPAPAESHTVMLDETPEPEPEQEKPAPKKRGRPPKAKTEEVEKPAPKKRGRPPKAKTESEVDRKKVLQGALEALMVLYSEDNGDGKIKAEVLGLLEVFNVEKLSEVKETEAEKLAAEAARIKELAA